MAITIPRITYPTSITKIVRDRKFKGLMGLEKFYNHNTVLNLTTVLSLL